MIQLQALNYILSHKDSSMITLNNLTDEFFSDYKKEFNYILNHIRTYNCVPDMATFVSKFPHFDVIDVKENQNYIIDELFNDRNMRFLATTFNKVRDLISEGRVNDAMSVYNNAQNNLSKSLHLNSVDIFKDTSRYQAYVDRSKDFDKYYVKTGFKELDSIIGGWDRQEELATIVARPNVGKSFILLKVAIAAAQQGLKVGLYSGEMSERKVGYRVDTLISHLSNTKLIHGNLNIQNDYKIFLDNLAKDMPGTIKVITPAMIGGPATVTALRAFIEKENLDMLCIDQHSLLEDDRKAKNPIEKAANISRDLKNLQVLKQIPIIAVSQQNRTSDDGADTISHIAQSDRIGQDSTLVLFLTQKDGVLTIDLVKSRDSVNGKKLNYNVDFDKGTFNYIPSENDALSNTMSDEEKEKTFTSLKDEFEYADEEDSTIF